MYIFSAAFAIFLVMDPLGNVPIFLAVLKQVESSRHTRIILRESLIALCVMVIFMFSGPFILKLLNISEHTLGIAGGIIIFIIALRMIFPGQGGLFGEYAGGEPLVVPLAIPLQAGPSTLATVMLLTTHSSAQQFSFLIALILAWMGSTLILLLSNFLKKVLRNRGLVACERLMGMILTLIAVQMFMDGVKKFLEQ